MGICSSCLGLGRRKSSDPETSRLLHHDPYRTQYGSTGQPSQRQTHHPDPEAQRREREVLEGICHSMSDNVVDVFSILPTTEAGVGKSSRGQGGDRGSQALGGPANGYKPSPVSLKQYKMSDAEPAPQERAYRSVRRAPIRTESDPPNDRENWEAAKAVMG